MVAVWVYTGHCLGIYSDKHTEIRMDQNLGSNHPKLSNKNNQALWKLQCNEWMSSRLTKKTTKWHVRPAKTQISLGIRPGWSKSLLFAGRKLGSIVTHWAHSEDSDQTGRMPRLIWVFASTRHFGWFCHEVAQIATEKKKRNAIEKKQPNLSLPWHPWACGNFQNSLASWLISSFPNS